MVVELQLCTFFLNGLFFGIDVQHVQEVIRPQGVTRVPLAPPDICGLINLRGQILTVIDLQQRLEMGESAMRSTTKLIDELEGFNIVVRSSDQVVSLLVDDVGDVLALPKNTVQPPPATLKGKMRQMLAGAYPLPEGFLLILDIEKILDLNFRSSFI
ncbi:chemotaxis protein CheW [Nostoc sp. 106C]|jgi:purine-binding chemotaxis protein CheW|uniref:chemotaxis protein CheW n=1 Tax=Nostoc sp. 106C TaxID=1932667 RepID=UPI000B67B8A5|nr:chemotaxis protein CheW [Nostoc sp. 106C]OUL21434.1 chemotaxis protein CheW [Nostoc sp. RF31YmG]OUL23714.1 chemotaxis protein CheW [Nostoc sp. 106C]